MAVVERDDPVEGVARLTLNRPEKRNAINDALLSTLSTLMDEVEADPDVRVVILQGAPPSFSAGFDLFEEAQEDPLSAPQWLDRFLTGWKVFLKIWQSRKPYVAVVRGHNLAGSLELSLLADVTLASDDAVFGAPEIRHASGPGATVMPWVTHMKAAKWLLLSGSSIDATTAHQLGIVTEVTSGADLESRSLEVSASLANLDPETVWLNKLALNRTYERMGMLSAIEENFTVNSVVHASTEYRAQEDRRREGNLKGFFARRDERFD